MIPPELLCTIRNVPYHCDPHPAVAVFAGCDPYGNLAFVILLASWAGAMAMAWRCWRRP